MPKAYWTERDPRKRARLKAAWEAAHPTRPDDSAAEAWLAARCKHWRLYADPAIGATLDPATNRILLFRDNRTVLLPHDPTIIFLRAALRTLNRPAKRATAVGETKPGTNEETNGPQSTSHSES